MKDIISGIIAGWKSFIYAIHYRFDEYEWYDWDSSFWTEISAGWYSTYIYPYDDPYLPVISQERQLRLSEKYPIIYLSEQDYDHLVKRLQEPPDPVSIERLKKIMQKPTLWDEK